MGFVTDMLSKDDWPIIHDRRGRVIIIINIINIILYSKRASPFLALTESSSSLFQTAGAPAMHLGMYVTPRKGYNCQANSLA